MNFELHIRTGRSHIEEFADRLGDHIVAAGGAVVFDSERPDMVLAVGGDGTMLAAVHSALRWDVPVLGFNLGTLGFLTEADPDEVEQVVGRLVEGDFEIEERLTVSASTGNDPLIGINDVVVEKVDSTRLISLEVVIDGTLFTTYRADGLIVATPTGSTAYSFSAGGPIIDPRVDALVLTPVASHSLFDRPMAIPADSTITATVTRDRPVRVNVDKSALGPLGEGDTVTIRKGPKPARFVTFGGPTFPGLVREKFGLE
ncbi:MAG TPA: NAD(+)/NADH kinase [Acidimicrobiia bacterium]|nr:NAD(+)/NADH kinase [Acidimicrobiia bacterium]